MMASSDFDLDDEIKELLLNYKYKKSTAYEPCTLKNFKECLIGLSEELGVFNIGYIFNPHTDVDNDTLSTEALVRLINSVWILLQHHKDTNEKAEKLKEQNHILEHTNKQLTSSLVRVKEKLNIEKNESKACVASAQRVSDQSNEIYQKSLETQAKLTQLKKQKDTNDKCLQNKIVKLQQQNEKLQDRLRNKSDSYTPCADICDSTLMQLKERERKHKVLIAKLQANNHELIKEVLALKEEIVLEGLNSVMLKK